MGEIVWLHRQTSYKENVTILKTCASLGILTKKFSPQALLVYTLKLKKNIS